MADMKIPYLVIKRGLAFWQPTKAMRAEGARAAALGPDGPDAWRMAAALNAAWRASLTPGPSPASGRGWRAAPGEGSLAAAFATYRATAEWAKKALRTREEWNRAWALIGPAFGDCRPREVTLAHVSAFRDEVERRISRREAHRALKIWRALWRVAAALKYCERDADPSLGVRNLEPKPRQALWEHGEVVRLAKAAWRSGYRGLSAAIAVLWDTSLSPVDVRSLRPQDAQGG